MVGRDRPNGYPVCGVAGCFWALRRPKPDPGANYADKAQIAHARCESVVRRRSWLATVIIAFAAILNGQASGSTPAGSAPQNFGVYQVSMHVETSMVANSPEPSFWWTVATDRSDSRKLVICALTKSDSEGRLLTSVIYGSVDRGATWRTLKKDDLSPIASETSCAFGGDGRIYYTYSTTTGSPLATYRSLSIRRYYENMRLYRSADFGKTWASSPLLHHYLDSAVLVVHPSDKLGEEQMLDFYDEKIAKVLTAKNGSQSYRRPTALSSPIKKRGADWNVFCASAVDLNDGTFGVLYLDPYRIGNRLSRPPAIVFYRTKADGSAMGPGIVVATISSHLRAIAGRIGPLSIPWPSMAVQENGTQPRIFVAWHDVWKARIHVLLSYSDDHGASWSPPRVVDDLPADGSRGSAAADPSIAVSRSGTVGLLWSEENGRCSRFAFSQDRGLMFKHSEALNICTEAHLSLKDYLQEHIGVWDMERLSAHKVSIDVGSWRIYPNEQRGSASLASSADGAFYAVWTGEDEDNLLHISRIELTPRPRLKLERWRRLPAQVRVWLDYTRSYYDAEVNQIVVGTVLVIRSRSPIHWPLLLHVDAAGTELGPVDGMESDFSGRPAAWIFDGPARDLPHGSRAEGDRETSPSDMYSKPRVLYFQLDPTLNRVLRLNRGNNLFNIAATVFESQG